MPNPDDGSAAATTALPTRGPALRATHHSICARENAPANRPVRAAAPSISTSYQSGTGGRALKWTKSVSTYGAFGKNKSHIAPSIHAIRLAPLARAKCRSSAAAHSQGTAASQRFHIKNPNRTSPEYQTRAAYMTTKSPPPLTSAIPPFERMLDILNRACLATQAGSGRKRGEDVANSWLPVDGAVHWRLALPWTRGSLHPAACLLGLTRQPGGPSRTGPEPPRRSPWPPPATTRAPPPRAVPPRAAAE